MMKLQGIVSLALFACGTVLAADAQSLVRSLSLASVFGDHMVLQRDITIPLWGKAIPSARVLASLNGVMQSAVTAADGRWRVNLPPMAAGGPYELVVASPDDTIRMRDVMLGDVWICSGQSNMEWGLASARGGPEEVAKADYPMIRLLHVGNNPQPLPQDSIISEGWKLCTPASVAHFSAVGFYFGKNLLQRDSVAIGLINASVGGTVSEAWTSVKTVKTFRSFRSFAAATEVLDKFAAHDQTFIDKIGQSLKGWYKDFAGTDPGLPKKGKPWHDPGLDTRDWQTMQVPGLWEQKGLPNFDGLVWFRKEIDLPKSWKGKDLTLSLGPIDDADVTWFNGKEIGSESAWNKPRTYIVPGKLVRSGKNLIAVRVLDTGGGGGLYGKPEDLALRSASGDTIPLAGAWQYKVGMTFDKMPLKPFAADNANYPTVLFNGMIAPLVPYAIRGAIWYQGESNASRPRQYRRIFPGLIQDWREQWAQGDFPFLFVQLANFNAAPAERWAELREAQAATLALPKTAMAVTIDIGDSADIHPRDKATVGQRLALAARGVAYGEPCVYSGPVFDRMEVEGDSVRVHFTNTAGGLASGKGEALTGFSLAGIDEIFVPASARIDGKTIVVRSGSVSSPVALRYGWASNPACNLYNSAGLPASPFRTDEWRNSTE